MTKNYLTITYFHNYYGKAPFRVGSLIRCRKDPDCIFDAWAIRCSLPELGTVGYIANSPATVAGGTCSAESIYDRIADRFYVRVLFTTENRVICRVEALREETPEWTKRDHLTADWDHDDWNEVYPAC